MTAILVRDNDITRPWVLLHQGKEIFRANTNMKCHRHAQVKGIQVIE